MDTFLRMTYVVSFNMYFLLILSSYTQTSKAANITCGINQLHCGNNTCISLSWKCDGTADCFDGSDEKDCPPTTCSENFFRCDNGDCIPDRWKCDGSSDCTDESDESKCPISNETKCDADEYNCLNTSKCISRGWVCDGSPDCKYKDDENKTMCSSECDKSEFQCKNKQCVSIQWRCDGSKDCADGSDEFNCTQKTECDTETDAICHDGECITSSWWCDGDPDCHDKSDEANCTSKSTTDCSPTEFQCHSPNIDLQCIHMGWMCDGDTDCDDGSDEVNCTERSCSAEEFRCSDSMCVSLSYYCDGEADCKDASDEKNCTSHAAVCPLNQFTCHDGHCIPRGEVCDGINQCSAAEDEDPTLCSSDPCKENNGMCMQSCVPNQSGRGRTCQCHSGYELQHESETTCQDINECEIPGTCSQRCVNTKGSYMCECEDGYKLVNHTFCKAKGDKQAELILSDRHTLRRFHLETFQYKRILDIQLAVAMDFNIRENQLYWSDVKTKTVYMANLNSTEEGVKKISQNLSMPDGIAVDWVHGNLYITDTGSDTIEVSRLNGSHRKTLVHTELQEPRAIVLDPENGWMYWTDWGNKPKIEKCGMNGQNRSTIVTSSVAWPNGLTIDYIQKRLYWVDAKLHIIASSNLDGGDLRIILKSHYHLGHPFSVTIFEDHLYWTDWTSNAVKKFNKFGKGNVTQILFDLNRPTDIHVYHLSRQPFTKSRCGENNGDCSHLCLPRPTEVIKYQCACPDGMMFGSGDQHHQCVPTEEETTTKKTPVNQPNHNFENRPGTDKLDDVTTKKSKVTPQISTDTSLDVEVFNESKAANNKSEEGAGVIALIVIVVLLCLGVLVIVVVFLLVKRYKKRNIKSMNFDNPVYRKTTTDDQLIIKSDSRNSIPSSLQPLTQETEYVV